MGKGYDFAFFVLFFSLKQYQELKRQVVSFLFSFNRINTMGLGLGLGLAMGNHFTDYLDITCAPFFFSTFTQLCASFF